MMLLMSRLISGGGAAAADVVIECFVVVVNKSLDVTELAVQVLTAAALARVARVALERSILLEDLLLNALQTHKREGSDVSADTNTKSTK